MRSARRMDILDRKPRAPLFRPSSISFRPRRQGIIPGAGDIVDAILNYTLVVRPAKKAEIPDWLVRKMLANNGVSAAVGFIPLVGDVLLGVWKANSRNAHL